MGMIETREAAAPRGANGRFGAGNPRSPPGPAASRQAKADGAAWAEAGAPASEAPAATDITVKSTAAAAADDDRAPAPAITDTTVESTAPPAATNDGAGASAITDTTVESTAPPAATNDGAGASAATDTTVESTASAAPRPGDPPDLATDTTVKITEPAVPPLRDWAEAVHRAVDNGRNTVTPALRRPAAFARRAPARPSFAFVGIGGARSS